MKNIDLEETLLKKNDEISVLNEKISFLEAELKKKETEKININNNTFNNNSEIAECKEIIDDLINKIDKSIEIVKTKESTDIL
ncbi:MAG: hypothetical protein IJ748_06665 [Bacteroidales bacterium]|nr:hypothetical protein [Bacteroidales bacterium]